MKLSDREEKLAWRDEFQTMQRCYAEGDVAQIDLSEWNLEDATSEEITEALREAFKNDPVSVYFSAGASFFESEGFQFKPDVARLEIELPLSSDYAGVHFTVTLEDLLRWDVAGHVLSDGSLEDGAQKQLDHIAAELRRLADLVESGFEKKPAR